MEGIERLTKERDAARVDLHVAKETQANLRNEKAALAKQSADLSAAVAQMTEAAEETFSYRDLKDRLADAVAQLDRPLEVRPSPSATDSSSASPR